MFFFDVPVLFCLLFPCILYHDGLHQIQDVMRPVISAIEQKLNIRRQRKGKLRKFIYVFFISKCLERVIKPEQRFVITDNLTHR
jgi:hypothetical protein